MTPKDRISITRYLWSILAIALIIMLVIGRGSVDVVVPLVFMTLAAGVLVSGFIWSWGDFKDSTPIIIQSNSDKHSDRLAEALRKLSDDELHTLRKRISRGEIDDDVLAEALAENVEQLHRSR